MFIISLYRRSLNLLGPDKALAGFLALAGMGIGVLQIAEPILYGQAIDALSRGEQSLWYVLLWSGLALGSVALGVVIALYADRLAHRRRLATMAAFFEHVMTLSADFHNEARSGRLMKIMLQGCDTATALWLSILREQLTAIVSLIVLMPVALYLDWRLGLLLFALMAVYAVANAVVVGRTQRGQAQVEGYHTDLAGRTGDLFGNVSIIQSFRALPSELQALRDSMTGLLRAQYPVLTWWAVLNVLTRAASSFSVVILFAMGAALVAAGESSIGEVVAFVGFATTLIARLDQISGFVSRLFFQLPALEQFFDVFDRASTVVESPDAKPLVAEKGEVRFEGVTFRYPRSGAGVENMTLTAAPGETVAIVGHTGSGKTTALALLQRVYDPEAGRILVDGQDIRTVTLDSLRHSIGVVFQESGLFNRSIAENIRIGRVGATDEEVEEAAKLAEAHEFIMTKPEGYQTLVGERGVGLSGGERQRLAIARALLKNAPILLLDEATSALDVEVERRVQKALTALREGRTTFMIAHRLSTVRNADKIVVLERGKIVEMGGFDELAGKGGVFSRYVAQGGLQEATRPTAVAPAV